MGGINAIKLFTLEQFLSCRRASESFLMLKCSVFRDVIPVTEHSLGNKLSPSRDCNHSFPGKTLGASDVTDL